MPYVDINPHSRRRPKWVAYAALGVLATVTAFVITLAVSGY